MGNFVNGGVNQVNGMPIFSKKRLIELIREDPALVQFYCTSALGPQFDGPLNKLKVGWNLVVTGPDPFKNRRWHANISRNDKDQVKIT